MTRRNEALNSISTEENKPTFSLNGLTIPLPPRTERQPEPEFDGEWLHVVENRWPTVCTTALDRLNSLPFSPLLKTFLEQPPEVLTHTITVSKSKIRKDILGFQKNNAKEDVRIAYQYFYFGREVDHDESTAAVLETTPLELFQLYAVVLARKTIKAQWLSHAGQRIEREVPSPFLERVMAQKPERGGPLMTVKP